LERPPLLNTFLSAGPNADLSDFAGDASRPIRGMSVLAGQRFRDRRGVMELRQASDDAGMTHITRNTTVSSGDERTRPADPLLAKHGRDSAVTRASTIRAGRPGDPRVAQRL
jgi:hypothetical protein